MKRNIQSIAYILLQATMSFTDTNTAKIKFDVKIDFAIENSYLRNIEWNEKEPKVKAPKDKKKTELQWLPLIMSIIILISFY